MPGRFLTGVSSPTATACCASVVSEDAIGSLVNVMYFSAALSTFGFRPLPSSLVSSALAAEAAALGSELMYELAWICPLSSPFTVDGWAFRNDWVTTRLVVTNLPPGHRLASFTSRVPPSSTISVAYGSGSQPPSIWPEANSSTAAEFGLIGLIATSPPPVGVVFRPCCFSQYRTATSWVLPTDGVASDLPLSCAALVMPFFTTREAPPEAAPEMILTAVPWDFCHALIAGLGPTYAASSWPARIAVVSSVPLLKTVVFSATFLPRFLVK